MIQPIGRLVRALRSRASGWSRRRFAKRFGDETSGYWYLDEHGLRSDDRVWYDPSDWRALTKALRQLKPNGDDVLIDIGSGKGRALLVAGEFEFARVIGLELSAEMNAVAEAAIARNRARLRPKEYALVTADVLEYELPDDVTIVYMYCPFVGDIFINFLDRLLAFVDRTDRPIRLVYNYPFHHPQLIETGRVEVLDVVSACWPARSLTLPEVIVTYGIRPSADTGRPSPFRSRLSHRARCWLTAYDPGFVIERGPGDVRFQSPNWRPDA